MTEENIIETGILVIGGGMAGCFAAIKAKEKGIDVTLVDKGYVSKSGATAISEGGFLIFNPEWGHKLEAWLDHLSMRSEYVNNREWGEVVLKDSYERYKDLASWGVDFDLRPNQLSTLGAGSALQVFIMRHGAYAPILRQKALTSGVKILDRVMIGELLKQDGRVIGAVGFHTISGALYTIKAGAVVMAAGASSLKEVNRATHYWTSDGDAMAYRAGADIVSKEFKMGAGGASRASLKKKDQASPKYEPVKNAFDAYARNPGFGGYTFHAAIPRINAEGQPINGPLWWEAHCGRTPTYVDLDSLPEEQVKDSMVFYDQLVGTSWLDKVGFDFARRGKVQMSAGSLYAVQPVHGGVGIWPNNTQCASTVVGLYAAGNNCGTMVSGANYASGGLGLCHAAVTGARAGLAAAEYALSAKKVNADEAEINRLKKIVLAPVERIGGFSPVWLTQILQGFMVPYFILQVKQADRLQASLTLVEFLNNHLVPKLKANDPHEWRMAQEAGNMALNSEMVLRASLFRTESRGGHYREDYPRRDDPAWLAWVKVQTDLKGNMKVFKEPIPQNWWPDLTKPYEERYPMLFPGEQ